MITTTLTLSTVLRCVLLPLMLCSPIGNAGEKISDTNARLESCRKQIDETDKQIVALLNQRARIVAEVGKIKEESHLPVAAPGREQQVLDHVVQVGLSGPLPPDHLRHIYQTVVQEMRIWEEEVSRARTGIPAERSSDQW